MQKKSKKGAKEGKKANDKKQTLSIANNKKPNKY